VAGALALEELLGGRRDADGADRRVRLEPRRHVDRVAKHIKRQLRGRDHARDERAAVEADAHLQVVLFDAVGVAPQCFYKERRSAHACRRMVGTPIGNAADEQIAVADRLDLEEAELAGDDVERSKELAEHVDELGGADARREGGEADKVDEHDRGGLVVLGDRQLGTRLELVDNVTRQRGVEEKCGELVLLDHRLREAAQLDLGLDLLAEHPEHGALRVGELTRTTIDDAKSAERGAVGGEQRLAGVEADRGRAGDERVAGEAGVDRGVGDLEALGLLLSDGVTAERDRARRLGGLEAEARLEPLPIVVDQTDQRNGRRTNLASQMHQIVKSSLGRRVQQPQPSQRVEPMLLVARRRRRHVPAPTAATAVARRRRTVTNHFFAQFNILATWRPEPAGERRLGQRNLLIQRVDDAIQRPIRRK
jgi:hypothetical protein